jgi:hypothetical protein
MRALAEVTIVIVLVSFVTAFTLFSVIAAFDATIDVAFTTFGTDDSLIAGEWALCDGFDTVTCE